MSTHRNALYYRQLADKIVMRLQESSSRDGLVHYKDPRDGNVYYSHSVIDRSRIVHIWHDEESHRDFIGNEVRLIPSQPKPSIAKLLDEQTAIIAQMGQLGKRLKDIVEEIRKLQ